MTTPLSGKRHDAPAGNTLLRAFQVGGAIFVVVCLVAFLVTAIGAIRKAQDDARRLSSAGHLKGIVLALHNYHDTYGSFPPAYIPDENGKPMHSWRVLILPFLEHQDLWDQYDFSRPWDDPQNLKVAQTMPSIYRSPFSPEGADQCLTPYVAISGPDTVLGQTEGRTFSMIGGDVHLKVAGLSNYAQPVFWTEPTDISPDEILAQYSRMMNHRPYGINVMVIGGSIHFVPDDTPPTDLEDGFHLHDGRRFTPP